MLSATRTTLLRALFAGAALVASVAARPAHAQVGTTTEIIAGKVVGPDSIPVPNATVDVTSLENGVTKHTKTREDGRFSMLFRDGGAQYRVVVRAIGLLPATVTLTRRGDEDRLVADIRLGRAAVQLKAVQVSGQNARTGAPPASQAGASERAFGTPLVDRLPVERGDLAQIAALTAGVVAVGGSDSTPAGFSVAGQPSNQNNVTVDGASFLFGTLPQNGVRNVRVVTNSYDVSRGQFTGGQVATTTLSGGSTTQGTATLGLQPAATQFPTSNAPTFGQRYDQVTGSFGIGGPVLADKLFYFVSGQQEYRTDPVASILDANPAALRNLGVSADSVSRFVSLAGTNAIAPRAGAPSTRTALTSSALARVDLDFSEQSSLMVRADYRKSTSDASRVAPLALPATGGATNNSGGGLMASVTSTFGAFINEARISGQVSEQTAAGFLGVPTGAINVGSDLGGAQPSQALLQFGGNASLPRASRNALVEFTNEFSWLANDAHRLKVGLLANASRTEINGVANGLGTFLYNSLGEFQLGQPALFARTLSSPAQHAAINSAALYVGDAWRVTPSLQIVYGARLEGSQLPGAPANNLAVETAFGRRTSEWPTQVQLSPRVGFTYLLDNVAGIPAGSVKGGVGLFRGTVPDALVSAVGNANGLAGAQATLVCAGAAVPTPNWAAYSASSANIPTACANGAPSGLVQTVPSVSLFDPSFTAPSVWRASFGFSRQFNLKYVIAMDALYAYGTNAASVTDLNLPGVSFTLPGEGNRPVYARLGDIVPATGSLAGISNRPQPAFGSVASVASGLHSRTAQFTVQAFGPGLRSGFTSLAYTYTRTEDQSNGFGLGAYVPTTAGDPNRTEWGTSDFERRHQFIATVFSQFAGGWEVSFIGRLISGPRYTPIVSGDVNGDGARNDRAYIPVPGSGTLGTSLSQLLASTDGRAADCLRAQAGRVAERNSCETPWTPQLDVQVNWQPRAKALDGRLTLSLIMNNTLAGLDQLVHGSNLSGWGQPIVPDRALLTVAGFDSAARAYSYRVNQRFGTPMGANNPYGLPFQLTLRAQVVLGTDPVKAQMNAVTGGSNGAAATLEEIKARIARNVPMPGKQLLEQADSLKLELTPEQTGKLTLMQDAYAHQMDSVLTYVATVLRDAGPNPDVGALGPKLQSVNVGVVKALQQLLKDMQATLTPAQWAKVPDKIKFPLGQQPGR